MSYEKTQAVCVAIVAGLAALPMPEPARAQAQYPERPIRMVIPFAPGGQTDIMGRRLGARMAGPLGQQIVIDNRSGAGGTIGSAEVARAKPDGYTLLIATASTHAINPSAMPKIPYNAVRDFAPISALGTVPMSIVIHPSVPARNLKQLVAHVRANPGRYSYGSSGVGGINHLAGELLKMQAGGLDIAHIPYKGTGLGVQDLIGGQIPIVISTLSAALSHHRSGRVLILAVASEQRSVAAPDIPTAIEAGVPGMVAYTFNALLAPAATPKTIIDRLHRTTADIMSDKTFIEELIGLGVDPITDSDPARAAEMIRTELARWAPVIKATGTTAN